MSVRKNDRKQSELEFIYNLNKLYHELITLLMKCPKRWDKLLVEPVSTALTKTVYHIKAGNSIYPTVQVEREQRRLHFVQGLANLQAAITLLDALFTYANSSDNESGHTFKPETIDRIMQSMNLEIRLIKGVMTKDTRRFATLGASKNEKKSKKNDDKDKAD